MLRWLFLALYLACGPAWAQQAAVVTWAAPTTRVDTSALDPAEIAFYEVFDVVDSNPQASLGIQTSPFTTPTLAIGSHTFTVVVTDSSGQQSAQSNAMTLVIPALKAAPSPPVLNSVTLAPAGAN